MQNLNPDFQERLMKLINDSPFPSHMKMRITDIAFGSCHFEMTAEKFRMQPYGVVHGGNLATLIDSAAFWACFVALGNDSDGLTSVDLKLNYLAPCRLEKMVCTGKMIKAGKTLFSAEASAFSSEGKLLANGSSILMRLPNAGIKLGVPMFEAKSR